MSLHKVPPDWHRCGRDNTHITQKHQQKKHRLLIRGDRAEINGIQAGICHGTRAKGERINIVQSEACFLIVAISIHTATVDDDRGDKDGKYKIANMNTVEVQVEELRLSHVQKSALNGVPCHFLWIVMEK